jgi:hypothetical protein
VQSTLRLVAEAPLERLQTGTRVVIELVGYPDGQMRLTTSEITGSPGSRRIVQRGFLMFVDVDEAKDALDAIADRVANAAADDA